MGTPPVTPVRPPLPKGTPPPTPPTNLGSPALRGSAGAEESEDGLTLEELEEQQRQLWAALENADNGTSDSDTGATGTPNVSSLVVVSPKLLPPLEMDEKDAEVKPETVLSTPASPVQTASRNDEGIMEFSEELIVLDEVSIFFWIGNEIMNHLK